VNALGDAAIVDALQTAAFAGAHVDLIVRGICTLRPGVPGVSERITVRSVLGRFLEHSRIFCFEAGETRRLWLGSADLLTRNLDKRIETLAPVENSELQDELVLILDTLLADTRDAWSLGDDGAWRRVQPEPHAVPVSAQETFMRRALDRARRDSAVIAQSG
jgi:polyphosphate kinase